MQPTIGRIVHYTLSGQDAERANRRRVPHETPERRPGGAKWPRQAQAHVGNYAREGDVVPLMIVRVWPDEYGKGVPGVNGQAYLDGNDSLWVTSAKEGSEPGTWAWPPRA